jgi:hypothetical protein
MSQIKTAINATHTKPWLEPIGMLVVNFGAVELQTFLWLADLTEDTQLPFTALKWPFKRRVKEVMAQLARSVSNEDLKRRCNTAWDQSLEVAKRRNAIVHNPILFGWTSGKEEGPPDVIGVADVARLTVTPRISERLASLQDVVDLTNGIARLAQNLVALRTECAKHREGGTR